jgi:hypothetical protein
MHCQQSEVISFAALHETDSEDFAAEIEWSASFLLSNESRLRPALALRHVLKLFDFEMERVWRRDHLHRLTVNRPEGGAQHFVAANYLAQRLFERLEVQISLQLDREWHIVGRAVGFHLVKEPKPLLRKREREIRISLDFSEWRRSYSLATSQSLFDLGGEFPNSRTLKQTAQRQFNPKHFSGPRNDARSE